MEKYRKREGESSSHARYIYAAQVFVMIIITIIITIVINK
tara:strand:+ start:1050 stop:1169 length:120 start_codon:yes stop_codon:yes gene_type:complete